ncbi:hypothetical protein FHR90_002187 [Endobacter medicaginis]|uniref:DUF2946 domain-containing protein n=2 Tax=Endobacter medicaginis TaxID=1181271 RepID=A0A839UX45_9PROT|nr:DUF2946 family protein [Endobacter medicaginis]MBB3174346.1 hypothetical protein [Endobacter medicaginis]MCX5476710.1 hypothetical protein [Endobacter medicaginis]
MGPIATIARRPGWRRRGIVLLVLQGLIGLLTLEAAARPGEMPRSTLERLVGDIAGQAIPAEMTMTGMAADADDMAGVAECCPPQAPDRDQSHHGDFRTCCALCGLLHLPPGLLPLLPALPLPVRGMFAARRLMALQALIVARRSTLPPARAPPLTV